ncbi:MAG: T9SS type A sorting domain-containing protein [Sphingobacteriales bacterium]|nr:MAG: T9SS type A sorting domain-containing protein [Sphingobacteriales bacterium]
MGHAFGLRHTFQGAVGTTCPPNASCLTQGDMICDTEPVTDQVVACDPTAINPCTGQPFGDVVYNYMGAACHDRFTAGQNAHMNTVLTTLRWTLDTSLGGTSLALIPPTPAANTPTISISTPQTSYCTNSQVIITATATYAGANPVYQWKINGVNAGPNSPTFVSTTLNSGDVISCVLTSSYGATCVTTNTAVSNSITITISSTIAPSISITAANTTVCASTQVSITATALNQGPTIPFFQWYVNGFPYGPVTGNGSTTNVLTYYPSDGDVVTCKLLASTSCSPNPWYTSNAVTINTIPSIAPTIAISASDSTVCSGSTITLNATYTNGGTTTPTITWMILNSMAGAIGSGPGPITLVVDSSIQIAAMLNVNNTGGLCYYQTVSVSDWLQIIADTPVVASVLISTPDTMFCPGSALQFTATPVNGGVNPLYSWMVNGAPSGVNTGTFSLSPADNDVITTQLFSNAACVATSPVASNSLTVHELPQPPTPVVTDFGTYFSSNYPNGQNQWHAVGVGPLAGEVNQLFYPSFSGSFYDVVTTVGCASAPSDTLQFPGTNAVTGLSSPDEVFYPNPSGTGEFLTPAYLQGRQAVIINSIGKVIKALTLERKLTLNEVPAGVYLLKTEAAGGTKYFRLVVAR